MSWVNRAAVVATALTVLSGGTRPEFEPRNLELIVYETQYCAPCRDFRYDTIKPYFQSDRGNRIPMQIVDYDHLGTAGRALKAPIESLPTTIILDHGREVGRIVGNPAHSAFIETVDKFIAKSR